MTTGHPARFVSEITPAAPNARAELRHRPPNTQPYIMTPHTDTPPSPNTRRTDLDRWPSIRIVCTAGPDWNLRARAQRFSKASGGRTRRNRTVTIRTFPQVNHGVAEADGGGRNRVVPEF